MTRIRDMIDSIANDNFDEARVALKTTVAHIMATPDEVENQTKSEDVEEVLEKPSED